MKRFFVCIIFLVLVNNISFSQYHYFGRNKVQYTDFNWQTLKTEHFDIFFYPEMKHIAEIGAKFAEESYAILRVKFNHNVQGKIPLVLYSSHQHFEQTNTTSGFIPEGVGGFFEFMKGRVVIPFLGSIPGFKHVIRHELVHVFMHSKITRVFKDHRVSNERYPPLWFIEGLAEHWSAEWDDQAEMVIRDAIYQDYIIGLQNIDMVYGSFAMYKVGQHVLGYISKNFGEEKILLLLENLWKAKTFQEVFKITIGYNYAEFDQIYLYSLKKTYYPMIAYLDQVTAKSKAFQMEGSLSSKPVLYKHNDSSEIVFVGNHIGYSSIYRKELKNFSKPKIVIQGEKSREFEAFHLLSSKIDVNDKGELIFATKSGENDILYVYDINQKKIIFSYRNDDLVLITSPAWDKNSKYIVFNAVNKSGYSDLYLLELQTEELTRLTGDFYDDRDPVFSPDGNYIVFSSDRSSTEKYNLFIYDLKTKNIFYLTYADANFYTPKWEKDKIYFTSDLDGVLNIWAIDSSQYLNKYFFADKEIRKLTNFTTSVFDPEYIDGDTIIFSSYGKFRFNLMLIDSVSKKFEIPVEIYKFNFRDIGENWTIDTKTLNTSSEIEPYKEKYNLDIAVSQVSTDPIFGTNAGAILSFSDMLGNDQYSFLLYNNAQSKNEILESFNIAIARTSLHKRTNYAYGIFNFSGRRYDYADIDEYFWERVFGAYFVLAYPLSVFQRIEASTRISNSNKDNYITERKALMVSNSIAFVSDNSIWTSTGPIDGHRAFLSLAYTSDIKHSNVNFYSLMIDYRHYLRLSLRSTYASRYQFFWNEGKEARRFIMGGSWDLRGYPRWSLRGTKFWLTNQELRFPLVDAVGIRFPFGVIGIGSVRGALFVDAGSVWDKEYRDTKGSFGFGLRFNFLGAIVFRYDVGYKVEDNFSKIGKKLFYQFFFGWDY
jgi:Tol biopolymer transport system component